MLKCGTLLVATIMVLGGFVRAEEVRLAVMGPPGADLGGLVPLAEVALGTLEGVTLVDREAIAPVLKEQELQAAFGAASGAERVQLGRILKADVLVLLRDRAEPKPHVEVLISETRQGIRLLTAPLPAAVDAKQNVAIVRELAERAIAKRDFSTLVAVPPLVNNSLTRDLDHYQNAYARLIEESVAGRDNVAVIELAEATAIAGELTLAGGEKITRKLPYYLEGEFRGEGHAEKCRVSFTLRLMRGSEQLAERSGSDLEPQKVGTALCSAAGAMLDESIGGSSNAFDIKAETKRLEQRIEAHLAIGNWNEAIALAEASLLIDPEQPKIHGLALAALSQEIEERSSKLNPSSNPREIVKLFPLMTAALSHMEGYFKGEVDVVRNAWGPRMFPVANDSYAKEHLSPADFEQRQSYQAFMKAFTARTLDWKAAEKVDDDSLLVLLPWAFSTESPRDWEKMDKDWLENFQRHLDERYVFIRKFQHLKEGQFPFSQLVGMGLINWHLRNVKDDELRAAVLASYTKFLDDLDALNWERIGWQLKNERKTELRPLRSVPASPPPPPASRELVLDQADAKLRPIYVVTVKKDGETVNWPASSLDIVTWMPIQDGIELIITRTQVFLMRDKGQLTLLPITFHDCNSSYPNSANFCWDGRYVWGVSPTKENQFLVAIDPKTEQIWKVDADAGLPPMDGADGGVITALAPGKAIVAGYFGRRWIASADLDPDHGIRFEVFHEARKVREDIHHSHQRSGKDIRLHDDPLIATRCRRLYTLKDLEAPDGVLRPTVALDTGGAFSMIDPYAKSVRVVSVGNEHGYILSADLREKIVKRFAGQSWAVLEDLVAPQKDSIDRSERVWKFQDPEKGPTPFRIGALESGGRYFRMALPPLGGSTPLRVGVGDEVKGKPINFIFPSEVAYEVRLFRSNHFGLMLMVPGDYRRKSALFTVDLKGEYAKPLVAEKDK